MDITITCKSYEELMQLARALTDKSGSGGREATARSNTFASPQMPTEPETPPTAPMAPTIPQMPPNVPTVPTSTASYTQDDLAKAAVALMDSGRRGELQQLLRNFGVASLPELPAARYGEFATALRGMGAPI